MDNKEEIDIQLDESIADGTYSNLVVINHSHTEFVMDFISMLPGIPKPRVRSRIIMTPEHVKSFKKALEENIERFEHTNGEISGGEKGESVSIPLNFGNNTYEA